MGSGAGLGGCHACIKYLMFAFNFVFWLIGCALVGFGIWLLVDENFSTDKLPEGYEYLQYAGIASIVVGGIVMIVGFFGCCGAIRESQCLLVMFFICMLILFLVLVAGGILVLVYRGTAIDAFSNKVKDAVEKYQSDSELDKNIDLIQSFFKCCGVDGPQDYVGPESKDIPESCIKHVVGCRKAIEDTVKQNSTLFAGIVIGAGALMLLGMIFSMLLCCAIRDLE